MAGNLPKFARRSHKHVLEYAQRVFTGHEAEETALLELVEYADGHYRAFFKANYFVLAKGQNGPSKSQWSSLKKKLKRHDHRVFVFKGHGQAAPDSCFVDFGFFKE